jgi:ferredoxin-type protein NapF
VQLLLWDLKKLVARDNTKSKTNGESRRLFLTGFAGILGGLITPRFFRDQTDKVIRPPFALPEAQLNMACARCGNCSSVCPTGIISQSVDIRKPDRLLTPVVSFKDAYCLPECNACGMVCPSGAIQDFTGDEKRNHVMGIAMIQLDQCYLNSGRECDLCRVYCDYQAIEIRATDSGILRLPVVLEKQCVGCGACQVVCPPQAIQITLS